MSLVYISIVQSWELVISKMMTIRIYMSISFLCIEEKDMAIKQ